MFTVYVIRSLRNSKRYIRYTSKKISERLREHNSGSNKFTKHNGPFKFIYEEVLNNKRNATKREKFLKSGQGRKFLDHTLGD